MRDPVRPRLIVIGSLGIGQIFAWGSSYYLLGVLADPIGRDTGWPIEWIVGALSLGLLVSGAVSPRIGRLIEHVGGRPVLAASAALLSAGLLIIGLAPSLPVFATGWLVVGLGMGAGLYDPAFATLGRLYGERARHAITQLTLFGGFASTICWPIAAYLDVHLGWRGACFSFAAIDAGLVMPLYLFGLPREPRIAVHSLSVGRTSPTSTERSPGQRRTAAILVAGFTVASMIMTIVAIQLIPILKAEGLPLGEAVGLAALVGPSQVGARVLEAAFGRRHHPIWSLLVSAILVAAGLAMLLGPAAIVGFGLVLYGSGSGIRSIARGTVPLALFGREGYATLMGRLAMPVQFAQAASPFIGGILLERIGAGWTSATLVLAAVVNIGLVMPILPLVRLPIAQEPAPIEPS
jgi:MFS family permease